MQYTKLTDDQRAVKRARDARVRRTNRLLVENPSMSSYEARRIACREIPIPEPLKKRDRLIESLERRAKKKCKKRRRK